MQEEFINREIKNLILTGSQFGNDIYFKEDTIEEMIQKLKDGLNNIQDKTMMEILSPSIERICKLSKELIDQKVVFGFSSCFYFHSTKDLRIHIIGGKDNKNNPITINSKADLASISKLFLVLLVYKMSDEYQEIKLDDTLYSYDKSLKSINDYTFLDTLKMSGKIETIQKIKFEDINTMSKEEARKILNTICYTNPDKSGNNYTDIGFIKLSEIITNIYNSNRNTKYTYAQIIQREILEPCHMKNSGYNPLGNVFGNGNLDNLVHDPKTRILGGESGSAGMFTPSIDLCNFAKSILDLKIISFTRLVDICSVQFPHAKNFCRGIAGIYVKDPRGRKKNITPSRFSNLSFSHQGFTGAEFMIDYQNQLHYHFLPNAIPNGANSKIDEYQSILDFYQVQIINEVIVMYLTKKYIEQYEPQKIKKEKIKIITL